MSKSGGGGAAVQRTFEVVVHGVVIAYAIGFAAWNRGTMVPLQAWFGASRTQLPVELVVFTAFVGGYLLASFFAAFGALRRFTEVRRLRRLTISLQDELTRERTETRPTEPVA